MNNLRKKNIKLNYSIQNRIFNAKKNHYSSII